MDKLERYKRKESWFLNSEKLGKLKECSVKEVWGEEDEHRFFIVKEYENIRKKKNLEKHEF